MTAQAQITASFYQLPNSHGGTGQSVVALPPSTDDPSVDRMRVFVDGYEIARPFDPDPEATG